MTDETTPIQRLAERFISEMDWSAPATEWEKLLAIGNVRGFAAWVSEQPQDPLSDADQAMIDASWKQHSAIPFTPDR